MSCNTQYSYVHTWGSTAKNQAAFDATVAQYATGNGSNDRQIYQVATLL